MTTFPVNFGALALKFWAKPVTISRIAVGLFCISIIPTFPADAATVWSVDTPRKQIAFTFDDGPKPETALPLIAMLEKLQVRATFFIVGREGNANIDILKQLHDQGHELANHTATHRRLPTLSDAEIHAELTDTNSLIKKITGCSPLYFRPPGGQFNTRIIEIAESLGLTIILWDVNAGDFVADGQKFLVNDESRRDDGASFAKKVTERITTSATSGSIVLMHNGGDIIPMLPRIVETLRNQGYEIVTVGELLQNGNRRHNANWNDTYETD